MRTTLSYESQIDGQKITVTRYAPSNGKRKKQKKAPVDETLHALDKLLELAIKTDPPEIIAEIKNSIDKRIEQLTKRL